MPTRQTDRSISRRTALNALGAGGFGVALAATARHATAQGSASPAAMAGHPLVGTWIVDPDVTSPTNMPSLLVNTADGIVIDPVAGFAGSWQATGPRTAVATICGFIDDGTGGYLIIRGRDEVDETGDIAGGLYTVTIVGPDGTVLATDEGTSRTIRLSAESGEVGESLPGFPTWMPATPAAATPTT